MPRERLLPPSEHGSDLCIASDCPMIGTIARGAGERVCFLHDGASGQDWPVVTASMQRTDQLLRLYSKSINASPGDPIPDATLEWLRTRGMTEIASLANEHVRTARQFGYALRRWLLANCVPSRSGETGHQQARTIGPTPLRDLIP